MHSDLTLLSYIVQGYSFFVNTVYFGPDNVPFESIPRLPLVTLDCQLAFGPHIDELKKKLSGRLKVLRCLSGRSWGRNPSSLRSLY